MRQSIILTPEAYPDLFGVPWPEILVETGLCVSLGEARRLVRQGGIRIDNEKAPKELSAGKWWLINPIGAVLSRGKRQHIRLITNKTIELTVDYDVLS